MKDTKRKKNKSRSKLRKIILILVLVLAASIAVCMSPACNVRTVLVEGNEQLSDEEILNEIGDLRGKNIFRLSPGNLEKKIEALSFVSDASVQRQMPDKLIIRVKECKTAMYIPFSGKMLRVDESGKIVDILLPENAVGAPVVIGVKVKDAKVGGMVDSENDTAFLLAKQYVNYLKEYGFFEKTTELDVSHTNDIQFVLNYKLRVAFGTDKEISYKMKYLEEVVKEVGEQSEGTINIRSTDHVTYKDAEATPLPQTEAPTASPDNEGDDNAQVSEEE